MNSQQFQLDHPPLDGITNVCFHPKDSSRLLVSSWDKTLRLYNVSDRTLVYKADNTGALLDCCFGEGSVLFSGSIDNQVTQYDPQTETERVLGKHRNAVRCVDWHREKNVLVTGSWDSTLRLWDPRVQGHIHEIDLPYKVFSMDMVQFTLAVAMAERRIQTFDLRQLTPIGTDHPTTLKYMLKSIRLMPNARGLACSSIEGRVMLRYFDTHLEKKDFVFKSHKHFIQDTEVVYPVNSVAFHPTYGTFASGGSDCMVNIWDGAHKRRIRQFSGYPEEIACLNFSHDGSMLAIASSYTFDEGERDHAPDTLFIRHIQESDVRPRTIPLQQQH
ncbi:WD40-repeat-containing domain protein [Sporodiniella umbellata]|nr:WD40-repeat-containing domain protein [Sporodiniella umbellata]